MASNDAPAPVAPAPAIEGRATVVMVEPITSAHIIDGSGVMNIAPLLQLMDICTCASAEKHTGVNCVTASMGDVVFEHAPQCGELLELTATPVYAGRTSLDIGLSVIAEGDGGVRQFVCYACFTYVTTRGPDGQKRLCPPLDDLTASFSHGTVPEAVQWARTVAYYRRALVKAEMKSTSMVKDEKGQGTGFDMQISEVVLPSYQNHMGHTFGGIVMSWMAKSALTEASRKSKRKTGSLLVRSVLRVEFASGSDVSDHLIFRPRLNAIFDEGGSAEIEVRVSKRDIKSGTECSMNVGYFYVSGSDVGSGRDKPFVSSLDFCSTANKDVRERIKADATWRRRLLLARRRLLGGVGEAVEWHPSLQEEAPLLTILAALRLVYHEDGSVQWKPLLEGNGTVVDSKYGVSSSLKQNIIGRAKAIDNFRLEYTTGEDLGRTDAFILRATGIIPNVSVSAVFDAIKNKREEWDDLCRSITVVEEQKEAAKKANDIGCSDDGDVTTSSIRYDIVEHIGIAPVKAMAVGYLCCFVSRKHPNKLVPLCLLRAWKCDENDGTAVFASQSVRHLDADKDSLTEVLPSGWFISPVKEEDGTTSGVSLTYVVHHDLARLRRVAHVLSDKVIISTFAESTRTWFTKLADISQQS